MAEARAVKFCTQRVETISSLAKGMIKCPKWGRGYVHLTNFCMHNCGLGKISPGHAVN